jgi:hypothetical protein
MGGDKVTLAGSQDWELLRRRDATTVIDPMLVRVADLFSRGASGGDAHAWDVIRSNLQGLATFVDALILEPGIPIFDYWYTGEGWGKDLLLFALTSPVVVPVGVEVNVWGELGGDAAVAMGNKPSLPEGAVAEIAAKLGVMGWHFVPRTSGGGDLSDTRTAGDPSGDPLVNSYLYVTLLFARYAAQLGDSERPGTQILSPGQSQIFFATAASEISGGPDPLEGRALFGAIEDLINRSRPGYERTWRSDRLHFLPYLLAMKDKSGKKKVRVPADLFQEALALRLRSDVSEYRFHLNSVQIKLAEDSDDAGWIKDLERASKAVQSALQVKPSTVTIQVPVGPGHSSSQQGGRYKPAT